MVKGDNKSDIIEQGDIFFFYRPKVGAEEVEDINDFIWLPLQKTTISTAQSTVL